MNLLGNAIDALEELQDESQNSTSDFSPTIWICTKVSSLNQVTVKIADNGSGITEEAKNQLLTLSLPQNPWERNRFRAIYQLSNCGRKA
jgi:signal transduction histidine kinase